MMLKEITLWASKLQDGLQLADSFYEMHGAKLPKNIKKIVFVGMGGSGIAGKIFKTFLDRKEGICSFVVDTPFVPHFIDSQTLAIVMSYSGETWETLDVLNELTAKFIPTIVVTNGGKAASIAQQKNIPLALLPQSLTPRSALGNFLGFLGGLFDQMTVVPGKEYIASWTAMAEKYVPLFVEPGFFKEFLDFINGYDIFHVWGITGDSGAVAYRATTQFNENSKAQACFNAFPELCHNLVAGMELFKTNPAVLFFYSDFLPPHLNASIQATSKLLQERRVILYKPPVFGDTFQDQIFSMILWSDFASYFLGKSRNVDVERVQLIEELKRQHKNSGLK